MNKKVILAIVVGMVLVALHAFSRGVGYHAAHALWRHL